MPTDDRQFNVHLRVCADTLYNDRSLLKKHKPSCPCACHKKKPATR